MPQSMSNIRVFVTWSEQTVFAGEDIECEITFKNVSVVSGTTGTTSSTLGLQSTSAYGGDRQRKAASPLPLSAGKHINSLAARQPPARGHRSTLSLNVQVGDQSVRQVARINDNGSLEAGRREHSHRRSVSIISLGPSEKDTDEIADHVKVGENFQRPIRGHGRAASLQLIPRRSNMNGSGPPSAPLSHRSSTQPSPLFQNLSASEVSKLHSDPALPERLSPSSEDISACPGAPSTFEFPIGRKKGSPSRSYQNFKYPPTPNFKFPAAPSQDDEKNSNNSEISHAETSYSPHNSNRLLSPRFKDDTKGMREPPSSLTRVLSPINNGETPRSSGEFYSVSNNSTETLASEYLPQKPARLQTTSVHARRVSNIGSTSHPKIPESLMMGYAQIQGSFVLDGSLIDQGPFDEVKRKGVLGGQGGGVIGIEKNKRDSGLLRGFGWANIGESLGGFLSGGELSSMRDMRGIASSKSVPLLSTPQSLLFVDLKLAPGESRTFEYSFKLPKGLPPTHRGKAIKIAYNIIIGVQRPGGPKEQQVKSVEVPFRVLGSVNEHGELLGHDLMSPYIIMRDQAKVKSISSSEINGLAIFQHSKISGPARNVQSSLNDFLGYVDGLLSRPREYRNFALLSPTENSRSRRMSSIEEPSSAKGAIDMAILRSNLTTDLQQSANRFEITRSGQRVAVIMLARPAYRLGETITAVIEFTDAEIQCYAVHASLETSEKVDPALAIRSDASIHRVTRKVHATHSESALFARRIVFSPTIPVTATPSFITSGVCLDWKIIIEFVTPRSDVHASQNVTRNAELLEEISRDERGVVLAAAEGLDCESFEIAVPLRIYGALAGTADKEDKSEGLIV